MVSENLASASSLSRLAGDDEEALALAEEARALAATIGNRWGESYALMNVYLVHLDRGEMGTAISSMRESIDLAERAGFVAPQATTRANLAWAYAYLGDLDRARDVVREALDVAIERIPMARPWVLAATGRDPSDRRRARRGGRSARGGSRSSSCPNRSSPPRRCRSRSYGGRSRWRAEITRARSRSPTPCSTGCAASGSARSSPRPCSSKGGRSSPRAGYRTGSRCSATHDRRRRTSSTDGSCGRSSPALRRWSATTSAAEVRAEAKADHRGHRRQRRGRSARELRRTARRARRPRSRGLLGLLSGQIQHGGAVERRLERERGLGCSLDGVGRHGLPRIDAEPFGRVRSGFERHRERLGRFGGVEDQILLAGFGQRRSRSS